MKLYEVKALAHETQSRIRQDLNAWNDFLEHASRVYRYRFMDQILIYAQRPDAVACATMNIWNSNTSKQGTTRYRTLYRTRNHRSH